MTDEAKPYPKASQLARGERRYRRKVASAKDWQRIIAAKQGPCRICEVIAGVFAQPRYGITYHHLVSRSEGGDDAGDNIVPLCCLCHDDVTRRSRPHLLALAHNLEDGEYAYIIGKLGESGMERLFGVGPVVSSPCRPAVKALLHLSREIAEFQ